MRIDGKVVVVTGAESGIGRQIALSCTEAGARVIAAGLDAAGLKQTVEMGGALAQVVDIRDRPAMAGLMRLAQERFGRLDAVVANAGVTLPRKPVLDVTDEEWDFIFSVNLTGTCNTVIAAARALVAQGNGGSIIATGSSTVLRGMTGLTPYVAAKSGVHGLIRQLAGELGPHRIRVNTLVPGTTATPLAQAMPGHLEAAAATLPMGEVVDPQELGRYVAFALSDALPHMTGALLCVDSGRTIA